MKLSLFNPHPGKLEGQVPLKVMEAVCREVLGRMWPPCRILNCMLNKGRKRQTLGGEWTAACCFSGNGEG